MAVKSLRLFIVVLIAVLLPIRGAVASAMLCPQGAGQGTAIAFGGAMPVGHDMDAMGAEHVMDHAAMHAQAGDEVSSGEAADEHAPNCHFCASTCCMASIVGRVPSLVQPQPAVPVEFPALVAPVPAFHSDGQERPPRTT